jgi:hypothetical protein
VRWEDSISIESNRDSIANRVLSDSNRVDSERIERRGSNQECPEGDSATLLEPEKCRTSAVPAPSISLAYRASHGEPQHITEPAQDHQQNIEQTERESREGQQRRNREITDSPSSRENTTTRSTTNTPPAGGEMDRDIPIILVEGPAIPTISDRGTAVDIITRVIALMLIKEGVLDKMYEPYKPTWIQFGITSARSRVVGIVRGRGLIGDIYVIDGDLPQVLISDITFTSKGVILIQDDCSLTGMAGSKRVLEGVRDPSAQRHEAAAMWRLDLRKLLMEPDPRIAMAATRSASIQSAQDVIDPLQQLGSTELGEQGLLLSCGAKPTWAIRDVRMGRRAVNNLGCVSAFTLASTIERGAFKDVNPKATPPLFRALGNARGNIVQHLTTARRTPTGGTGIPVIQTGYCVSFDDMGKFLASIFGIIYAVIFRDEASKFVAVYGLLAKTDLLDALRKYCQYVQACGKGPVRYARCDATSLVSKVDGTWTEAFTAACAELGLQILPSAPEDQRTNPVERSWQTLAHRACAMMLNQDNGQEHVVCLLHRSVHIR